MPRRPRIESAGYHHVINRGVARRNIFLKEADRDKFLQILCESAMLYDFALHSYCLMDNHYHLLIETKSENLSLLMCYINSNYAVYFNKSYHRVGPLWQGRFKSWYILNEKYLYTLLLYIEQNPLKARLVENLADFKYSSYSVFIGKNQPIECLKNAFVFEKFANVKEVADFFKEKVDEDEVNALLKQSNKPIDHKHDIIHFAAKRPIDDYFKKIENKKERDQNIYQAFLDGHTQSAIANALNITQVNISRVVKKFKEDTKLKEV